MGDILERLRAQCDCSISRDAVAEIERLRLMVAARDQMFAKLQRKLKEGSGDG